MGFINGLHFNNIRGDIYGGLTAAVIALPLAMAFGVASGVGPAAGLYGAIFVGFFAAVFGGTPAQISGPTGPMTVVMAAIFTQYTGMFPDDPMKGAALAFTVVMLGGVFQIIFGILRLGKYIELVPHPVISGFMSGIGVIIILLQIGPLLGHASPSKPLAAAQSIPDYIGRFDLPSLVLGIITLVIVYMMPVLLPKLNRLLPASLSALILGTVGYIVFMPAGSTPVIGEIPTGFPDFQIPAIDTGILLQMLVSSLTLAGLGSIDSLLTSLVADNITRTQHQSDRELVGQGIGNTIAGMFGGLPGAGATMRTVVNVNAGGSTPISGMLHAIILLAIVLGAGVLAQDIPKVVLAGILIKVGTDIIDWDYLKRIRNVPKTGVLIMVVVFMATVVIDLLFAVGIGMVMASFLLMHRMAEVQKRNIRVITKPDGRVALSDQEESILKQANGQIILFHLSGPMSFPSAKSMVRRHAALSDYSVILLDLVEVPSIDFTTGKALGDIITGTIGTGRRILLVGAREEIRRALKQQGALYQLGDYDICELRADAFFHARDILSGSGTGD